MTAEELRMYAGEWTEDFDDAPGCLKGDEVYLHINEVKSRDDQVEFSFIDRDGDAGPYALIKLANDNTLDTMVHKAMRHSDAVTRQKFLRHNYRHAVYIFRRVISIWGFCGMGPNIDNILNLKAEYIKFSPVTIDTVVWFLPDGPGLEGVLPILNTERSGVHGYDWKWPHDFVTVKDICTLT